MNEAERYLERRNKNGGVEPKGGTPAGDSAGDRAPAGDSAGGGAPHGSARKPTAGTGSGKGWSVGMVVFGVAATMFWMLFFKSCY